MPKYGKYALTRYGRPVDHPPKGLPAKTHRVYDIENDGLCLSVMFERVDGQLAIGIYKRIGWAWCPDNEMEPYERMARSAPVAIYTTRKAGREQK